MAEGEVPGDYIIKRRDLHDVCFLVGSEKKEKISTIKCFLVNYSLVFRSMLLETDMKEKSSNCTIPIPNHEPDVFKLMLSYVYGVQNLKFVDIDQAMRFHLLVDQYLMPKLKDLSSSYLMANCTDICDILKCIVYLNMKQLISKAQMHLHFNSIRFLKSEDFKFLDRRIVEFILKLKQFDIGEIYLWRALLSWAEHNSENGTDQVGSDGELEEPAAKKQCIRGNGLEVDIQKARGTSLRETMGSLLTYVRFLAMSQKEFADEVVVTSILTDDEVIQIFLAFATGKPYSLQSLSAETKRLRFISSVQFTKCLERVVYDHTCHHTIEVHDRNLKLTSLKLRNDVPRISVKLMQDNTKIDMMSDVVPGVSGHVGLHHNILKAHTTYDLILTLNAKYDPMKLWRCIAQPVNDCCTVSEGSTCIEHLILFVVN